LRWFLSGDPDFLTIAMAKTTLTSDQAKAEERKSDDFALGTGTVTVHRAVDFYLEIPWATESAGITDEVKKTKTNPIEFDSTAFWIEFTPVNFASCGLEETAGHSAVHALEHVLRSVFPLVADVDPGDVGSTTEGGDAPGSYRLYLYDSFAGGTGLAEFAFRQPRKLLDAAADLLTSCPCREAQGCPRCTILPWCEARNEGLSKAGAIKLLQGLAGVT
jgi:DEAD/DEAH box helicase domain-containing protein